MRGFGFQEYGSWMGRRAPEELAITQVLLCKLIRAGSRTASFLGAETAESSAETTETAPAEVFWSGVAKTNIAEERGNHWNLGSFQGPNYKLREKSL